MAMRVLNAGFKAAKCAVMRMRASRRSGAIDRYSRTANSSGAQNNIKAIIIKTTPNVRHLQPTRHICPLGLLAVPEYQS